MFDYSEGAFDPFDPFDPGKSSNCTGTPFLTMEANASASQLVILTQPWDSDLLTREGSGVPCIP